MQSDDPTSSAATEPWQRHAWEDETGERCGECGQPWPCDIAKAVNFGIGMGQMMAKYGSVRRPLR